MKKILTVLMLLSMMFALSSCGEKANDTDKGSTENLPNSSENSGSNGYGVLTNSKTVKWFEKDNYYMKSSMKQDSIEIISEMTVKDGKMASKSVTEGGTVRIVEDNEYIYSIMDDSKSIMKAKKESENEQTIQMVQDFAVDENVTFTTGNETIEGINCDYEDFEGVKYYYQGNDLKFIKSEDMLIKILAFENKAKDDMFKIPTDYADLSNLTGTVKTPSGDTDLSSYMDSIPDEYKNYLN